MKTLILKRRNVVVWSNVKRRQPPRDAGEQSAVGQHESSAPFDASKSVHPIAADGANASPPPARFHPFANIFPMVAEDHLQELARDIKDRGLLDPIVVLEGQILDGRCRYRACKITGVEPKFENYAGDDPLGYVLSRNLHRRHLSESQRAMVAAKVADLKRGANQHSEGLPIGRAAAMLNVSNRSVARAKEVLLQGSPELVSAVEAGELPVSAAAEVSRMPESVQRETVASGVEGSTTVNAETRTTKRKPGRPKKQNFAPVDDMVPAAEVERLKTELAAATERLRHVEQELENARVVASRTPSVEASMKTPAGDDGIPLFLDRRPLSAENQLGFDAVMEAWANSPARTALLAASPIVHERFISMLRVEIASSNSATE
jgi:ParB-like chromosome segregation protein Spo0J